MIKFTRTVVATKPFISFMLFSFLLFLVSNFGYCMSIEGIFWDDWTIFGNDSVYSIFSKLGDFANIAGHYYTYLWVFGPASFKIVSFGFYYLSCLFIFLILTKNKFSIKDSYLIGCLLVVLPLNPAKMAAINSLSLVCYFLFFLAWYLCFNKNKFLKFCSLFFFFFSFLVPSQLLFYFFPMFNLFLIENNSFSLMGIWNWFKRHFLFIVLPFLFLFLKASLFPIDPKFIYYNNFAVPKLMIVAAIVLPCILSFIVAYFKPISVTQYSNKLNIFLLAILMLWFGALPYIAVGKTPDFQDWNSRHQLLLPLGTSLLLWIIISSKKLMTCGCLIALISCNWFFASEFYLDWLKQEQILHFLKNSDQVRKAKTIVFDDQSSFLNVRNRHYRFYEYNGWLSNTFGFERKFGLNYADVKKFTSRKYDKYFLSDYRAKEYIYRSPELLIRITSSKNFLDSLLSREVVLDIQEIDLK